MRGVKMIRFAYSLLMIVYAFWLLFGVQLNQGADSYHLQYEVIPAISIGYLLLSLGILLFPKKTLKICVFLGFSIIPVITIWLLFIALSNPHWGIFVTIYMSILHLPSFIYPFLPAFLFAWVVYSGKISDRLLPQIDEPSLNKRRIAVYLVAWVCVSAFLAFFLSAVLETRILKVPELNISVHVPTKWEWGYFAPGGLQWNMKDIELPYMIEIRHERLNAKDWFSVGLLSKRETWMFAQGGLLEEKETMMVGGRQTAVIYYVAKEDLVVENKPEYYPSKHFWKKGQIIFALVELDPCQQADYHYYYYVAFKYDPVYNILFDKKIFYRMLNTLKFSCAYE